MCYGIARGHLAVKNKGGLRTGKSSIEQLIIFQVKSIWYVINNNVLPVWSVTNKRKKGKKIKKVSTDGLLGTRWHRGVYGAPRIKFFLIKKVKEEPSGSWALADSNAEACETWRTMRDIPRLQAKSERIENWLLSEGSDPFPTGIEGTKRESAGGP